MSELIQEFPRVLVLVGEQHQDHHLLRFLVVWEDAHVEFMPLIIVRLVVALVQTSRAGPRQKTPVDQLAPAAATIQLVLLSPPNRP